MLRVLPLSRDGVASIQVLGSGKLGEKSLNLFHKAKILGDCGFLFPRRNLVVTSNVLLEGLSYAGLKGGWAASEVPTCEEFEKKFHSWATSEVWPAVENTFEGRACYVRSDAPGDSLGRGVYLSVPFVNRHIKYGSEDARARSLSTKMLKVATSYFNEVGVQFRERCDVTTNGINVFISQFIGRVGDFLLGGKNGRALAPFLAAVVKTRMFSEKDGGIIRFEYGLGSGALKGKTVFVHPDGVHTLMGKLRATGTNTSFSYAKPEIISLPHVEHLSVDNSNWGVISMLMRSAYGLTRSMEQEAASLLNWLVENNSRFERLNKQPIYLELIASSFKVEGQMRWFAVQAADYAPKEQITLLPSEDCFVSNSDFSGHGIVEGRKRVYIFAPRAFSGKGAMELLREINEKERDFIVVLPQQALSGVNLTDMSASHLSNASAVIEYERLSTDGARSIFHTDRTSSEHFEQLALDFQLLFIPVDAPFGKGEVSSLSQIGVMRADADVLLVCDRERGIAWGKIGTLEGLELLR